MGLFSLVGDAIQIGIDHASTVVIATDPRYNEFRDAATLFSHGGKAVSALGAIVGISAIFFGAKAEKKTGATLLFLGTTASWISYNGYQLSNNLKTIAENPGTYYNVFTERVNFTNLKDTAGRNTFFATWIIDPLLDALAAQQDQSVTIHI